MSCPTVRRPSTRRAGALLLGVALAVSGTVALPTARPVRAVVAYDGPDVALEGLEVVRALPGLGMVVVEGTPAALGRVSRANGVRGVAPDDAVVLAAGSYGGSAVRAAEGLGGRAGKPGAGRGVRVAMIDTGVSDTAALSRGSGRLRDAFDADGGSAPFDDGYGHGTFLSSVVAGGPVQGSGGRPVGVAPGATVLVVRVARPDGSTSLSQVLAGLDWVARHPGAVDVVNLSLSHSRPGAAYGADPLTDAVERVRSRGVTVVVSSGNDPDVVGDPGFTPKALTVGAADITGDPRVAAFSGSDVVAGVRKPDVVANGVGVLGVLPRQSVVAQANPAGRVRGELWPGSGTSQAAAVVSGAVALLLERRPEATPVEVKALLRASARPLAGERDGAGLLRLARGRADGADGGDGGPDVPGPGPDVTDPTGEVSFDASSWSASSWSASSWSASSWSASSWSASSWSAVDVP